MAVAPVVQQDQSAHPEAVQVHTAVVITQVIQNCPMSMTLLHRDQGRGNVAPRGIANLMTLIGSRMMTMITATLFRNHLLTIRQWPLGLPHRRTPPQLFLLLLLLILLLGLGILVPLARSP